MSMSKDFIGIPPTLLEAMHQMYGDNIKSVTVCTEAFDGEQEILSLEDGEELEVEYPDEEDPVDECPTHHILLCPDCNNCEKCAPNVCYVNHWS